ncbi:choice-of-anchor J domain-containing protein [Chryseobacterium sp. ERMR1:04]|uniref:T9SS-dependent choice-of-anchor J family protein n=1 Tax=Chryseobacterium sp. ERMR1:04 TaxID=1705393 RepID=UPI0006C84C49|nr:choice-of-anchor J domain-containing protein [Chryseobacterium sp. ERMR1:04]KPH11832.1 hypothetical protein AMQ68_20935 [Chryseobacterium sp. ERMR1:04]
MKHVYRLALMLGLWPLSISAQYSQSFDSATLPSDWTIINGGDTGTWKTWTSYDSTFSASHSGSHFLGLEYGSDAHSDYAISPAIVVTAGVSDKLTFWGRNRGAGLAEIVDLKISTTTPTAAAFTTTLASAVKPPVTWQQYTYDLTPYVGQTIYIAFYSTTTDIWFIGIDDFVVSSNTLAVSEAAADKKSISIYPNPVGDILTIESKNKISEINIYDMTGRAQKLIAPNSGTTKITMSDLSAGNYVVKIKEGSTEKSYKIIKK